MVELMLHESKFAENKFLITDSWRYIWRNPCLEKFLEEYINVFLENFQEKSLKVSLVEFLKKTGEIPRSIPGKSKKKSQKIFSKKIAGGIPSAVAEKDISYGIIVRI